MRKGKPTVDEIKELFKQCQTIYGDLTTAFEQDEKFYELQFKDALGIPEQYADEAVVLPTARDMPDAFVDHIDISNARAFSNKKGTRDVDDERAEMMRRFYLGMIHRTNTEADISPWRVAAKHYAVHGLAVFKTVWDADSWLDKPAQLDNESQEDYEKRIEEWQKDNPGTLPILIKAIHPANIYPDPSYGGRLYVIEHHQRMVFDVKKMYPHWKNEKGRDIKENVEYLSYWDNEFRCDLVDGQPILKIKGGVVKHNYGFIPYTLVESGLGNLGIDAKPEQRYVGMNRYAQDLLISESRNYSVADVILKKDAWRGGYVTGEGKDAVANIKQEYGTYTSIEDTVVFHDWDVSKAPEMIGLHLARTSDLISSHAAPRSVRGLSETGVRSGADRRLVIAEAAARFKYSKDAFKHGTEQVLIKCAQLFKNVVPDDVRLWAMPADEADGFDVVIKKSQMKEPFTCYVEFAPISEEDEYRRQDSLNKLWNGGKGLITRKWARSQMSNINVKAMEREDRKEMLRQMPSYLAILDQAVGMMAQQAFGVQPQMPQETTGATQSAPEGSQRAMVPPIPNRATLGSPENLSANMPVAPTSGIQTRGRGGGGARG